MSEAEGAMRETLSQARYHLDLMTKTFETHKSITSDEREALSKQWRSQYDQIIATEIFRARQGRNLPLQESNVWHPDGDKDNDPLHFIKEYLAEFQERSKEISFLESCETEKGSDTYVTQFVHNFLTKSNGEATRKAFAPSMKEKLARRGAPDPILQIVAQVQESEATMTLPDVELSLEYFSQLVNSIAFTTQKRTEDLDQRVRRDRPDLWTKAFIDSDPDQRHVQITLDLGKGWGLISDQINWA